MLAKLRSYRPSHATVVAYLALFVALGGSAYAVTRVGSRQIVDNSIRSKDLRDNGVRGRDVRNGSLGGDDLRADSVSGFQVAGLTGADVAPDSLTGSDIADLETSDGVVKLDPGQSAVLFESGPFSIDASCRLDVDTKIGEVTVTDRDGDSAFTTQSGGSTVLPAGEPRQVVNVSNTDGPETHATPFLLASPGGTTVAGYAGAGVNALSSPCFFFATGLGGTGVR